MNLKVILLLALFLGVLGFVLFRNNPQPPIIFPTATPDAKITPVVNSPRQNEAISSPTTIAGTVPPGWMFEGVFPIQLLDKNKKVIVAGLGKEKTPGSWQSGNPVEFTASITFTTTSEQGFLVLEKDNPSGLPENSESFEIPVSFKK